MSAATFYHRIPVRFRDVDAMGHVNNAVFLTYLEEARIALLERLARDGVHVLDHLILAHVSIDYRAPVFLQESVEARLRLTRIGGSSFTVAYRLSVVRGPESVLAAEAETVQVYYDYQTRQPAPLPASVRQALAPYLETAATS